MDSGLAFCCSCAQEEKIKTKSRMDEGVKESPLCWKCRPYKSPELVLDWRRPWHKSGILTSETLHVSLVPESFVDLEPLRSYLSMGQSRNTVSSSKKKIKKHIYLWWRDDDLHFTVKSSWCNPDCFECFVPALVPGVLFHEKCCAFDKYKFFTIWFFCVLL